MRVIDADEYEKRIKPYDTEDDMDKALYNFAHYHLVTTPSAQPDVTDTNVGDMVSRQAMPGDGDLISRRSLLRNILKRLGIKGQEYLTAQESVIVDCIYQERSVESAHQDQKKGEWVYDGDPCELVCNNCGYRVLIYNNTNYCQNCGNYNGGNQDEI